MIIKLHIWFENKIVLNKFKLNICNNYILIDSLSSKEKDKITLEGKQSCSPNDSIDTKNSIIKIIVYNKYNGIDYMPLCFPLKMYIIDNLVFNPYIILSSYNLTSDNNIDFFYNIEKILNTKYNLKYIHFDDLSGNSHDKLCLFHLINNNYPDIYTLNNQNNIADISLFINNLWFDINMIKLLIIFIFVKFPHITTKNIKNMCKKYNISNKIGVVLNQMREFKYVLTNNKYDYFMTYLEYNNYDFSKSLELSDIKIGNYYYLVINKIDNLQQKTEHINILSNDPCATLSCTVLCDNVSSPVSNTSIIMLDNTNIIHSNKVIKILVSKINENSITIYKNKKILFEDYKWYYYHPNITIDKNYIIFNTYNNNDITCEIIRLLFQIDIQHSSKIVKYYQFDNKLNNLLILPHIFEGLKIYFDDIAILKSNSYTSEFFEYITKKYSNKHKPVIYEILSILFSQYNYPLKTNRRELDDIFDYILYFSLYNYKYIILIHDLYEIINPIINNSIPYKIKNLYINLLKTLYKIINNNFEAITYNQKFYYDYLYKHIIKIFLTDSNKLSINLFKKLVSQNNFNKFKKIITTNFLLIDISNKLSWNTLSQNLHYLNLFYKNSDIIYYQNKLNKTIIPHNFDTRIKKIIENPFEMYRYLRKKIDFEKWTIFISDKIPKIFYNPISLSTNDFTNIGTIIYLLLQIEEQNIKDSNYMNFIKFCNEHIHLIIESNRININIKDYFSYLKININLGFLAKHLIQNKDTIYLEQPVSNDIKELELKLQTALQKYYKYKNKYKNKYIESNDK
jgi:hypothetical protein